jgi:nitrogenase iron protein NifH
MKQIALYGKGSIGKSTVASHLAYSIASRGKRVLQVGCDPQSDGTQNLTKGHVKPILTVLAEKDFDYEEIAIDEIVHESRLQFHSGGSIYCAEAGGPDPGVGCGGKGAIEAINTLKRLHVFEELHPDLVIYDILGDVVCGGFSMPIRDGFADETYIVTSGELEALYQANNVMGAVQRFANRSGAKLGGLIVNLKGMEDEERIVRDFASKTGTEVLAIIPCSQLVKQCSGQTKTVFEEHSDSPEAQKYTQLADTVLLGHENLTTPLTMTFEDLYEWWSGYIH